MWWTQWMELWDETVILCCLTLHTRCFYTLRDGFIFLRTCRFCTEQHGGPWRESQLRVVIVFCILIVFVRHRHVVTRLSTATCSLSVTALTCIIINYDSNHDSSKHDAMEIDRWVGNQSNYSRQKPFNLCIKNNEGERHHSTLTYIVELRWQNEYDNQQQLIYHEPHVDTYLEWDWPDSYAKERTRYGYPTSTVWSVVRKWVLRIKQWQNAPGVSHFFGFGNTPYVTSIPLPEILDIVFFEKMAAFLVKIKFKLRGLVAQMGPITWDSTGFLENIIIENREHIAHVNGFNELIIDRMCEYLDVVLNDWNGDCSDGRVSHATFFFDETIDEELLDELVARQTPLGQAFVLFD